MMNKIYKQTIRSMKSFVMGIMLLSVLSLGGCSDFLDVQPAGELPNDQLLNDAAGFEAALYGVYATMAKPALYGEHLSHNMMDLLAQYFVSFGNERVTHLQQYNYKHSAVEASLSEVWSGMYNNISNVNNVLRNLERFSPENLRYYNLYKGEALGLRAFMHFDLLRLYTENIQRNANASGIPYAQNFSLTPPDFQTASTVYERIIADLKAAEELLAADVQYIQYPKVNASDNFIRDRETHLNLYAVQATLARVYFTKGDMLNALLYAEKVINSGKFELMDRADIGAGYGRGTLLPGETIFGLYSTALFPTVQARFLNQTTFFSYNLRPNLKNRYEFEEVGHDYRWDGYIQLPTSSSGSNRFVKLVDPYQVSGLEFQRPSELIVGINLIRLPEMYYIAAEASLSTNPSQARDYFDQVIESRGLVALKDRSPAQNLTVERITAERYKEFIGEGQTFFNMKRLHLHITDVNSQNVPASNEVYVLPIPLEEHDYRK